MQILRTLFKISWRNVFRNKRRSALTLSILILGCTGLILVGGFFEDNIVGFRETYIHSGTGHIQVNMKGYFRKGSTSPLDYFIESPAEAQQIIEGDPRVDYTLPRIRFGGMLSTDKDSISVLAYGVDPDKERKMANFRNPGSPNVTASIKEGKDLDPKDSFGIIMGSGLASSLGLKVGDHVSFIMSRGGGTLDGADFEVRGIFETTLKEASDRTFKLNLKTAQDLLGIGDKVQSELIVLKHTDDTEPVRLELEKNFEVAGLGLEAISWKEQGTFYKQSKSFLDQIYRTIQFIMCLIFITSIANTINMAMFERMREYGTMMALGNNRSIIFSSIFFEGAILGLIGASLGILTGIGLAHLIAWIGIPMPPPPSTSAQNTFVVGIMLNARMLVETFLIAFIATLISSVIPGYRAAHLQIVKALGYV